jgi:serine/threonine protein phosphatase 1
MASGFWGRLFGRDNAGAADQYSSRIPDGERLYAIGDIHGRFDLLQDLQDIIDSDGRSCGLRRTIVYLGDYIDRGMGIRQVIDLLLTPVDDGVRRIFLLGNHEAMLLDFLESSRGAGAWLANGGIETLGAYGVSPPDDTAGPGAVEDTRRALREQLPPEHLEFFESLQLCHQSGDYFFVHAGVRPGVPLAQQIKQDMIWIRNDFLDAEDDFSKIVVHGHSIRTEVEELPNRIGIDTGAYMSGRLTALVLEGDHRRYLST